ncbi:jg18764 [Pararge aegeria aegeria]|uniref:Jg18764 protein n=1 Tax=Pararge aegeria aegeria TaxID=348720 RepID=A0A8S4S7Y4_9NEOP|nr:jg18764 [Pararge aegeria aegeria]
MTYGSYSFSFFGRTLAANHLRGCYGVTGGVGRARKLAMRRAPGLDDIGGETYGSETWSLTMGLIRRLRVTRSFVCPMGDGELCYEYLYVIKSEMRI